MQVVHTSYCNISRCFRQMLILARSGFISTNCSFCLEFWSHTNRKGIAVDARQCNPAYRSSLIKATAAAGAAGTGAKEGLCHVGVLLMAILMGWRTDHEAPPNLPWTCFCLPLRGLPWDARMANTLTASCVSHLACISNSMIEADATCPILRLPFSRARQTCWPH